MFTEHFRGHERPIPFTRTEQFLQLQVPLELPTVAQKLTEFEPALGNDSEDAEVDRPMCGRDDHNFVRRRVYARQPHTGVRASRLAAVVKSTGKTAA